MKRLILICAAALAACSPGPSASSRASTAPAATTAAAPVAANVPAGDYTNDKSHSSLILRISHMGYSHFTARFATWDAQLHLDPANLSASTVSATIDPRSLEADNPPAGFLDQLRGPQWLDAAHFPQMSFRSISVTPTGPNTARIVGDFTMHDVTKPVTLEATFNGGYPGMELDPHARAGFSAHGVLKRSDFGISSFILAPHSNMGVGDDIEIIIESEFSGPAWHAPAAAPQQQH